MYQLRKDVQSMSKNFSPEIQAAVENFFAEDDWHYEPMDENGVFRLGITLKNKFKNARIFMNVLNNGIVCLTVPPMGADKNNMTQVNEFITRANYGLNHGNFELDFRDGEIRYKTSLICGKEIPTFDQIKEMLYINVMMLERYGNGLAEVMFGMSTPEEAIKRCEEEG